MAWIVVYAKGKNLWYNRKCNYDNFYASSIRLRPLNTEQGKFDYVQFFLYLTVLDIPGTHIYRQKTHPELQRLDENSKLHSHHCSHKNSTKFIIKYFWSANIFLKTK